METDYVEIKDQKKFDILEKDKKDALAKTWKKYQKALYAIFQAIEELIFGKISCGT